MNEYFNIEEHIGVIETYQTGWSKELNIVAWNGGDPKYDIRDWSISHERMTRGIRLTETELKSLYMILKDKFENQ